MVQHVTRKSMNNIFTIKAITKREDTYVQVTGTYQLDMLPEATHFERGDILTEDKYNGHQIYVSFSGTNTDGEHTLILDNASQHPDIKKPFTEKVLKDLELGLHLFKHDTTSK
jgi:hypothetical protein